MALRGLSLTLIFSSLSALMILAAVPTLAVAKIGPKVGERAPAIQTKDIHGKPFDLHAAAKRGPVVVVFYRGGWCPYCNLQLRKYQSELLPAVKKKGGTIVALSVDQVKEGVTSQKKHGLGFTIISDNDATVTKRFGLAFTVPADLVKKYKTDYKIDIEAASGRKHHMLPIPAVYVVGRDGKIVYAFADQDYKKRAPVTAIKSGLAKAAKAYPN